MTNEQIAIGIDIGGTNTKLGIFNLSGDLKSFKSIPTAAPNRPETFIELLAQECEVMLKASTGLSLGDPEIVGVGAGAPMANYFTGKVELAPNLGWKDVALRDLFQKNFKCHAVIENDANLAAVGENKWGAGKKLQHFILVTLGTGVGTGLILDGKLYRGHGALGAEGGHVLIPHTKQRRCSCGGVNHLESYLSARGIKDTAAEITGETWSLEELNTRFHAREPKALEVIHQIAEELASGLCSMGVLLGPEAFVIGGGVSQLGPDFFAILKEKLEELIHFSLKDKIQILPAALGSGKGAVYGGAAHVIDEVRP